MNQNPEERPVGSRVSGDMPQHRELDAVEMKNRVQVGPILAGVLTTLAAMLILTVLGLAIGASALDPSSDGSTIGTFAGWWGVISALISFFLGGWVAARTAAVAGPGSGLINGLMAGAAVLVVAIWLVTTGAAGLLGTLGGQLGDIVNLVQGSNVTTADVEQAVQDVDGQAAFDTVQENAWWTLLGLILALAAAAIGGLVGKNEREDVIQVR